MFVIRQEQIAELQRDRDRAIAATLGRNLRDVYPDLVADLDSVQLQEQCLSALERATELGLGRSHAAIFAVIASFVPDSELDFGPQLPSLTPFPKQQPPPRELLS